MRAVSTEATTRLLRRNLKVSASMARNISFSYRGEHPSVQVHNLLTSGKGQPINEDVLFQYSNGRFLADEEQQFQKRHVKFDVRKLCDVVVSLGKDGAPVCKIDKMEGGFSKALLMTTEDGMEVIAKIPCPNAGRAKYSTASEAAVLEYGVYLSNRRSCPKLTAPGSSELTYNNPCSEDSSMECRSFEPGRC